MIEHVVIDAFVRQRVIGHTELFGAVQRRVFKDFAPEVDPDDPAGKPPVYPLVVFIHLNSHDSAGAGSVVIQTDHRYRLILWGEGKIERIVPTGHRLDALFRFNEPVNFTLGPNTYIILGSQREAQDSETGIIDGGKTYSRIWADYRIYMNAT